MGSISIPQVDMIDIRSDTSDKSLLDLVRDSLKPKDGSSPSLPTLLLYDEKGLKLFEDITYLDEYYLTNAEIEAFTKHADSIASRIQPGSRLIELGSGNLRKVNILLEAFERARKPVDYYALDLSRSELERTFAELDLAKYDYVKFNALHGTYDDGFAWLADFGNQSQPTCLMTLGSSLGNFDRQQSAAFLAKIKDVLKLSDLIVVGLDSCLDADRVHLAYNDTSRTTEKFYRNALDHTNQLFGRKVFKQNDWQIEGLFDQEDGKHQASFVSLADTHDAEFAFQKGQRFVFEYAYKYSDSQMADLWRQAGLVLQNSYGNGRGDYFLHVLSPSKVAFNQKPKHYATHPEPSVQDWQQLWNVWDTVTKSMVPREELINKPIQLRNNLIFYLGHIPTFADIHYCRATSAPPVEPSNYSDIFERGIDPDVDDPSKCHAHSTIPDEWPPLQEILEYETRVRARILESVKSGLAASDRKLARSLWLAYEHEAMHLETFLYMLLHSPKVLSPPAESQLDFAALAREAASRREVNAWHTIPDAIIKIGMDDPEDNDPPARYYAWDNERPARQVHVPSFEAQSRSISNGDYALFLEETNAVKLPASWLIIGDSKTANGPSADQKSQVFGSASSTFLANKAVRTVYGPLPLSLVLDWPVMASYDELAAYAVCSGGRIPSFEEVRSIYNFVDSQTEKPLRISNTLVSAVNSHLCNDGVEETPPSEPSLNGATGSGDTKPDPDDIFIDVTGCNVAFKNWRPTPVTGDGKRLRGQGDAGGLWEWTSSPLAAYEGFKPMDAYPGYTADFFDDKHNICLGGSWATAPRIAGRKSFVNWYQRNYPFSWTTARLVRDFK